MKIKNHRLMNDDDSAVPFRQSPNVGGSVQHRFLVMHFTAGRSAIESVEWLASRKAKASAHVVIGRDGSITQLVPFDRVAWHAGASSWEGLEGLNNYSLGIELDNAGRLTRQGEHWRAWFGGTYDDSEVIQAVHKHETSLCGWHDYTPAQIDAALQVAGLLVDKYALRDVVGHEDIAPSANAIPARPSPWPASAPGSWGVWKTVCRSTGPRRNSISAPAREHSTRRCRGVRCRQELRCSSLCRQERGGRWMCSLGQGCRLIWRGG